MSKTVPLAVTCSCKSKKEFIYPVQAAEPSTGSAVVSLLIDCPFHHDKNCIHQLTIQLPPGMKPRNDENILRR